MCDLFFILYHSLDILIHILFEEKKNKYPIVWRIETKGDGRGSEVIKIINNNKITREGEGKEPNGSTIFNEDETRVRLGWETDANICIYTYGKRYNDDVKRGWKYIHRYKNLFEYHVTRLFIYFFYNSLDRFSKLYIYILFSVPKIINKIN